MRRNHAHRTAVAAALLALLAGCVHDEPFAYKGLPMPPLSGVPRELEKVTLPPYVVEPPDKLAIDVVTIAEGPVTDKDGKPVLDPNVNDGKTPLKEFKAYGLPLQGISGQFSVGPDGCVFLGLWGRVPVAGLTLDQVAEAIRDHISRQEDPTKPDSKGIKKETLRAVVDVLEYNSKRYYVIFDGGGAGEQVIPFPVTGSETVMDAIANVNGLPQVASKRNIWVARRSPYVGQYQQILPVDWVAITQHGSTLTNHQVLPGDRIYVKAQRLVTLDTTLARVFTPIERVFGITLLGASTVNQINGRTTNIGN